MLSASHTLTPSSSQTLSISHPQTLRVEAETNNTNTQTTAQDTTHGTPMTQTVLPLSLSLSLIVLVVSRVNCPLDERNERNQHSLHRAQPEFTKHGQNPNTFCFYFSTGLGNRKHCVSKKILDMTQDMTSTVFPTKNVAACKQQTKRNNTNQLHSLLPCCFFHTHAGQRCWLNLPGRRHTHCH